MKYLHNAGLYIHIPFCKSKCAYCDFYSSFLNEHLKEEYIAALIKEIKKWGGLLDRPIDSIYVGGGTPSVLGDGIEKILSAVYDNFDVCKSAEITAEVNPAVLIGDFLTSAKRAGVNRLSIGMQSGIEEELKILKRNHTVDETKTTFYSARKLGFENISLDLMMCLPKSSLKTLEKSLDFLFELEPEHVSAYMLSIEPNTAFAKQKELDLPDEEEQSEQYLYVCEKLEQKGYEHYEISNFAKSGFESRHNNKYWKQEEYLGIGPSAHSFLDGKRFFYPRDVKEFIKNPSTVFDEEGGSKQEAIMLGLRLKSGVRLWNISKETSFYIKKLETAGLVKFCDNILSLTDKGMLVSNNIITEITELVYENL